MKASDNQVRADNQQERLHDVSSELGHYLARFPLRSARQAKRLEQLLSVVAIMAAKAHYSSEGIEQILNIRELMISNRKRKYQRADVMQNPQRLHAKPTRVG